jgi:hypothetical protein
MTDLREAPELETIYDASLSLQQGSLRDVSLDMTDNLQKVVSAAWGTPLASSQQGVADGP